MSSHLKPEPGAARAAVPAGEAGSLVVRLDGAALAAARRIAELRGCDIASALRRALGTELTAAEHEARGGRVVLEDHRGGRVGLSLN